MWFCFEFYLKYLDAIEKKWLYFGGFFSPNDKNFSLETCSLVAERDACSCIDGHNC